jgi:hypothetical protein
VQVSHAPGKTHAVFDDDHVVAYAGLVPVMRLAERCDLAGLAGEHVSVAGPCGANTPAKIGSIVAGMAAGADCIDDLDLLRHGGMTKLFDGVRAPSTLGSFLRAFTWGNVRQLEKIGRQLLIALAKQAPLLPGAEVVAFLDIDSTQKRIYGPAKQGAGFGHTKIQGKSVMIRGLNALAAVLSTPLAAPVITGTRLRGGSANSARGAASLVSESIGVARAAGTKATLVARLDSAFYSASVVHACLRQHACFSITAKMDKKIKATIAAIPETAWQAIKYPSAVFDEQSGRWISDAQVAETPYTAFTSHKGKAVTARLIVRRVKDLNPQAAAGQDELFTAWRYHAVFTNSPFELIQAEAHHRGHAIVEQVFADLFDGPLAHLPSGDFNANAAWLTLAAITHNLTRAAGCLAGTFHGKARAATLRRHLITIPARLARAGRDHITLHLPRHWPWRHAFTNLFHTTHRPPPDKAA